MKHAAAALALALLAVPAAAQVEIRGLTVTSPDKPGNGGIMLKGLISTRLPGTVSMLWKDGNDVFVRLDGKPHRLMMRNGQLVTEATSPSSEAIGSDSISAADMDGDGKLETILIVPAPSGSEIIVTRAEGVSTDVLGTINSKHRQYLLTFVDVMRDGRSQAISISQPDNCLRVISFANQTLRESGSLNCGALITAAVQADIDTDGRDDLVVARQPDRIEIFLR